MYHNLLIWIRDLYNANKTIYEKMVNNVNDALIDLRNALKKSSENVTPDKDFDKQQKG